MQSDLRLGKQTQHSEGYDPSDGTTNASSREACILCILAYTHTRGVCVCKIGIQDFHIRPRDSDTELRM